MTQAELDKAPFFVKGPAKEGAEKYARQVGASQVTLVSVSCLLHLLLSCFTCCFTARKVTESMPDKWALVKLRR
jgi:hypothetical protein